MGTSETLNKANGWLLIDKPTGISSYKVVATIKRILKIPKVGHSGTLDPEATGILAVAVGEATKTISYQTIMEKSYTFKIVWGKQTDTDDSEGKVIKESINRPQKNDILNCLPSFKGYLKQTPPKFSAKKINGKKAYELARNGQEVTLAEARIQIFKLQLIKCHSRNKAEFFLNCSKGTYVRSIARDLGNKLGCYGHAVDIRRIKTGNISIEETIKFSQLEKLKAFEIIDIMLPTQKVLDHMKEIKCNKLEFHRIINGQEINADDYVEGSEVWASFQNIPIALGKIRGTVFLPKKVLNILR